MRILDETGQMFYVKKQGQLSELKYLEKCIDEVNETKAAIKSTLAPLGNGPEGHEFPAA